MTVDSHVAILVCDGAIDGITQRYGDFGDNTAALLAQQGVRTHKYYVYGTSTSQLTETYHHLQQGLDNGTVSGMVLTGSRSDAFATGVVWIDMLNTFLHTVLGDQNPCPVPIAGICFGHQIMAKNLGCTVGRNPLGGWECGTTPIAISSSALALPMFEPLAGASTLNLSEFHQDVVLDLPQSSSSSFVSVGSTAKCAIQGMVSVSGPLRVLTFQGHPEFHRDLIIDMVQHGYDGKILTQKEYDAFSQASRDLENQGAVAGAVLANFFNGK
ncbi:class I glutamine amidotransferase-like protein [Suhomyces tanzawaensis NRRL Y-17324]|uniref:Class I glutamine amidotransferase-like protein n=1 Tax=Suhomyces tanzawaensis NRRL Y-17324 TaxID=984487 RepID=A0A1E4SK01_9ASCO|nr:class I glutamine amidotransferase-like protein [Suhomyces tanzawaensis NRRL Y-17324]ODV79831.1 class I glutamine amidotransferase-like protein [Suhomyces tanzawaensis NRRL Y-17324]